MSMAHPERQAISRFSSFVTRHTVVIFVVIAACALFGLGDSLYAAHKAETAQKSTLALTQSQGDQIKQLKALNAQAADLAKQIAAQTAQRAKDNAALLCGGFVPISHAPLSTRNTTLGFSIVNWAIVSAKTLHCPDPHPVRALK